jgi:cysteine-rich repeat protein
MQTKGVTSGVKALMTPCVVGLMVVAGIGFGPTGALALDPGPKCEAAKLGASAKQPKCRAGVFAKSISKAEAPDAAKLAKCDDKFDGGFSKAEEKGGFDCPTTGDGPAIEGLLDACIDGIVTDLGGAPGAGGDEAKCQSKKLKEVGKYAKCRLKADSTAIKKAAAADYSKCNTKLSDKWAKIEAKPPCLTTGDLAAVKAKVDACQLDVSQSLTGVPLCGNGTLNSGEQCDDGNVANGDGCSSTCQVEVTIEYQQDFEGLNAGSASALGDDGWLVGANVFAGLPPGGAFLYNYFAFPAPNGGAAFSAVATGEGGAPQGAQQLSIYSDYNNGDHANGNTIEANVFRARTIVAGDVGKVFTFQFDRKLGNLNSAGDPNCPYPVAGPFLGTPCANTALAFIKVFDPVFTLLDFPTADMTSISTTWGTSSVTTAPIPAGAVGGQLQFGFLNKASLYQPSGIFYDNVTFSSVP